jgi:hypothetical protein
VRSWATAVVLVLVGLVVAVGAYAATQFHRFGCVQPLCPPVVGPSGAGDPTAFPGQMDGFWTGSIHQTDGRDWSIELRINEGATVATVLYRDLGCAGTVTVAAPRAGAIPAAGVLRAREHITSGTCTPDGSVTLTATGGNLDWAYVPDGDTYTAKGRLSRTAPPS